MNVKIVTQEENPLLERKDIVADVTFQGVTPSRKVIKEFIAKETKSKEDLVIVHKIDQEFGFGKALVNAVVYKNKDAMERIDQAYMSKRGTAEKKKKEAPKETPKAAEVKKEEVPADDTKETPAKGKKEEAPAKEDEKAAEEPEKKEEKAE